MAIQLKLKKGETVERGLKRLKKILDKEGIIKTLRVPAVVRWNSDSR